MDTVAVVYTCRKRHLSDRCDPTSASPSRRSYDGRHGRVRRRQRPGTQYIFLRRGVPGSVLLATGGAVAQWKLRDRAAGGLGGTGGVAGGPCAGVFEWRLLQKKRRVGEYKNLIDNGLRPVGVLYMRKCRSGVVGAVVVLPLALCGPGGRCRCRWFGGGLPSWKTPCDESGCWSYRCRYRCRGRCRPQGACCSE